MNTMPRVMLRALRGTVGAALNRRYVTAAAAPACCCCCRAAAACCCCCCCLYRGSSRPVSQNSSCFSPLYRFTCSLVPIPAVWWVNGWVVGWRVGAQGDDPSRSRTPLMWRATTREAAVPRAATTRSHRPATLLHTCHAGQPSPPTHPPTRTWVVLEVGGVVPHRQPVKVELRGPVVDKVEELPAPAAAEQASTAACHPG